MSNVIKLTEEQGLELSEAVYAGDPIEINGHSYTLLDEVDDVESRQLATIALLVYKRDDGELFGMHYDYSKFPEYESGFIYSKPALTPVEAREVKTTEYVTVEEA